MKKNTIYPFFVSIIMLIISWSDNVKATYKYDEAIELCNKYVRQNSNWGEKSDIFCKYIQTSDIYEKAMTRCGATDFRRYAITTWFIGSDAIIELHHIAGDMQHIVSLAKDPDYRKKIHSAMNQEYLEEWAKSIDYFSEEIQNSAPSGLPDVAQNTDNDMCDAFIKMINLFKILEVSGERAFLENVSEEYNKKRKCYSYEPYTEISLAKYRKQRYLSIFWHPKHFTIYDTAALKSYKPSKPSALKTFAKGLVESYERISRESRDASIRAAYRREAERDNYPTKTKTRTVDLHSRCSYNNCQDGDPGNCRKHNGLL